MTSSKSSTHKVLKYLNIYKIRFQVSYQAGLNTQTNQNKHQDKIYENSKLQNSNFSEVQTLWSSLFRSSWRTGCLRNCKMENNLTKQSKIQNIIQEAWLPSQYINRELILTALNQKSGTSLIIISFLFSYKGFLFSLYSFSISRTLSHTSSLIYNANKNNEKEWIFHNGVD